MGPELPPHRHHIRQSTVAAITAAARRLLVARGSAAVTVNAVAREMGMSGPALYHYYPSRDALVEAVTAELLTELTAAMRAARDAADTSARRLLAVCRALRTWAVAHPAEFGWVFASPMSPGASDSPRQQAGQAFERVFLDQVVELWEAAPFPVPRLADMAPGLADQLRDYTVAIGGRLPAEAVHVFLSCWVRLYGLLCMDVLGQLDFAYADRAPVFEECLRELSGTLCVTYEPPD